MNNKEEKLIERERERKEQEKSVVKRKTMMKNQNQKSKQNQTKRAEKSSFDLKKARKIPEIGQRQKVHVH